MSAAPRLLLVDDRDENLLALEALLRGMDAEMLRARSGREALELLLAHEVALAIVDVQMPEMDGFELAELMRGAERTREVPIIFVTAGLHDSWRIFRGYEAGAVDFLHKPLDAHVLRGKVRVFLQLYRQKQQLAAQLEELRRAEHELREADRRKDEFIALLSHELRNPLAPVRTSVYILQRAAPGSDQASRARDVIDRQTAHLSRLVDDLLDVSRITRGKVQLRRERLDLGAALRRTAEDHRAAFAAAEIALEVSVPAEPVHAQADPTRLAQIVGNLLGNAVKFTPRGGRVELSLGTEGGWAVIQVCDNGPGIPPELRSRIFDTFAQADRTLDRSRGGLGLGLALVKGMTELHGGTVSVGSGAPECGAVFAVRLPLESAAAAPPPPGEPQTRADGARRVLVIEDNADAAESLRTALELMGHSVEVAADGDAGLELARRVRPDVVLCDIGLPGLSGYQVARQVRADPQLRSVRLVALSGYAQPEDQARALDAGFDSHLAKPANLAALERTLVGAAVH